MRKKIFGILIMLFISTPFFGIENDTIYYQNQNNISIVNKISQFADTSNKLRIIDIIQNQKYFVRCSKNEIHIPFDAPKVWFKCIIKNISNDTRQINLELENATIYQLQFFHITNNTYNSTPEMGIKYPFDNRPIKTNTFIHRFTLNSGESVAIYFSIISNGDVLNIPVKLYSNDYFFKKLVNQSTMLGVIMGFIFALIMIAFYSLYLSDKDNTYLIFALYSIFGGLWIVNNDGYTFQYLLSNFPATYILVVKMVPLIAVYLYSQFGIRYLNIKDSFKYIYTFLNIYNWIALCTVIIMPLNILTQSLTVQIETFEIISLTVINLILGVLSFNKNRSASTYYLIANIVLIVGILAVSFNILFGLSSVELRGIIIKLGLLFQMTVLLFALTNKIRKIQKLSEIQLKDSRQKYFDILENALEAIFIVKDRKIKFSNTQLSILTKYRVNELFDFDLLDFVHIDDKEIIEKILNQQQFGNSSGKKSVFRAVDKEGFEIWMELITVPIIWEHNPATLNFMNDISLRVNNEREKGVLEKQLLHAQKMETIGTLAGGIAHDFNNILTPIIGYSELIYESTDDDDIKEDVLNIKTSAIRAKDLVSQILRFSHQIDSTREYVNVNKLTKEVSKLIEAVIPSSISIKTILSNEPLFVYINESQLHQVLMNICTNAYQSITYKGRITVSVSQFNQDKSLLIVEGLMDSDYIRISIEDNGSGIPAEIKSKIFDPFFTTKKVGEGTGLGLSVVYGIVKNNGGLILCDSSEGKGTRFDILLPKSNETFEIEKDIILIEKGNNEEILIVDDEEKISRMLKKQIDGKGFKTTIENKSIIASELIKADPFKFKIVITDVTMPELTGIELAKISLQYNKNLKIIFVTGHISQFIYESIKEIPNAVLISKPIDFSKLHKAINDLLV